MNAWLAIVLVLALVAAAIAIILLRQQYVRANATEDWSCSIDSSEAPGMDSDGQIKNLVLVTSGCSRILGVGRIIDGLDHKPSDGSKKAFLTLTNNRTPLYYKTNLKTASPVIVTVEPLTFKIDHPHNDWGFLSWDDEIKLYINNPYHDWKQRIQLSPSAAGPKQLVTSNMITGGQDITIKLKMNTGGGSTVAYSDTFYIQVVEDDDAKWKTADDPNDCPGIYLPEAITVNSCASSTQWKLLPYDLIMGS